MTRKQRLNDMLQSVQIQLNRAFRLKRRPRRWINFLFMQRSQLEALGAKLK